MKEDWTLPSLLEAASSLSTKLLRVVDSVRVRLSRPSRISLLLLEREVKDRLRDGLQVVELGRRVAMAFEEEETLRSDAVEAARRQLRKEREGESENARLFEFRSQLLPCLKSLGPFDILGQVYDAEFDKGDCRKRESVSLARKNCRKRGSGHTVLLRWLDVNEWRVVGLRNGHLGSSSERLSGSKTAHKQSMA